MAARRPEALPLGLRSAPRDFRAIGSWRPVIAVFGGVVLPSVLAFAVLHAFGGFHRPSSEMVGTGPAAFADLILFSLMSAPVLIVIALPLGAAALLIAVRLGFGGLGSAVLLTEALGLPVVHVALHGDVTTESPAMALPAVMLALAVIGAVSWRAFWALQRRSERGHTARSRAPA